MSEKIGLVLAGGGAKGAYQAEIASRLLERKNVSVICGVSVGALNGALLSQNQPNELRKLWANTRRSDVWSGGHGPLRYFKLAMGWALGIFDPEPLHRKIEKNFNPNNVEIPFKAGAVSLGSGQYVPYEVRPESKYDASEVRKARRFIVASSAVPVGVEPVEVDGSLMIDGGTRNIAPVGDAIKENPDRIIAIFNRPLRDDFLDDDERVSHVYGVGKWALEILLNETVRSDVQMAKMVNDFVANNTSCDIDEYEEIPIDVIEPSRSLGDSTDFSKDAYVNRVEIARNDIETFLS